jgi:hypothetical protein
MVWKYQKNINLKQRKKYKKFNFFQKRFWNGKTNRVVFESVVAVVFQSVLHSEMHQNNIFFIF